MQGHLYWIMALVCAFVLIIILSNEIRSSSEIVDNVEKSYRQMMFWVIFFCLWDALWGLCQSHIIKSDGIFYIASMVFHLATVLTTFFWLKFILEYLGDRIKHPFFYLTMDVVVIAIECVVVTVNLFKPILFSIEDGQYVTQILRPLTFFNQYIVYLFSGFITLLCAMEQGKKERERFLSVFVFTLAPILTGIFQLLFPDGPFYSLGYFLGCFVIHIFVVAKEKQAVSRNKVFTSLADIYYTMHIINMENDTAETLVVSDIIYGLTNRISKASAMLEVAMKGTVSEDFLEAVLNFVDLSTLSERMRGKKTISFEFIGVNYGWTRVSFIVVEREADNLKKVMMTTQIIDAEKRSQMELVFQSSHDELSGLLNRRAYEEELDRLASDNLPDNLVYLSMDLNGLKVVNDTMGHAAGDEIIIGAAECIRDSLGAYGKVFRTGGDEFIAIIEVEKPLLKNLLEMLDDTVKNWSGELVPSLSLSIGYAAGYDYLQSGIHDIAILADKKMYEKKNEYYRTQGIDRRGQKDAHSVLCAQYTKILRINLTEDTYQVIDLRAGEATNSGTFGAGISGWFKEFAATGSVHPEDVGFYYEKTNIELLRDYFCKGNDHFILLYRRKLDGEYKHVMMEILPAPSYTNENQDMFLYVKCLEN